MDTRVHISLAVSDLGESLAFYSRLFGTGWVRTGVVEDVQPYHSASNEKTARCCTPGQCG